MVDWYCCKIYLDWLTDWDKVLHPSQQDLGLVNVLHRGKEKEQKNMIDYLALTQTQGCLMWSNSHPTNKITMIGPPLWKLCRDCTSIYMITVNIGAYISYNYIANLFLSIEKYM